MLRCAAWFPVLTLLFAACAVAASGDLETDATAPATADAMRPTSQVDARHEADAAPRLADAGPSLDGEVTAPCEIAGDLPAAAGSFVLHHFQGSEGSRDYWLYLPTSYDGSPRPLVVLFHGCTQTAQELSVATGYNRVAEALGVLVAWPEQSLSANGAGCWNWFLPAHQQRGAGEPAIVAAIVSEIVTAHAVDPQRTYVGGFSAGASMALVMAATYPDRFAAVASVAGCPYSGGCYGLESADLLADGLLDAMGAQARAMPIIVANGSTDTIVQPAANQVTRDQFLGLADRLDDGEANHSVPAEPMLVAAGYESGLSFQRSFYAGSGGQPLAEHWVIDGLSHAWCGGAADQPYASDQGPDLSRETYRFLCQHPMP